jgi:HPt (histidine-containing phosphotransfer) domain-containing protein
MTELGWNREFALEQAGDDEEMLRELLDLLLHSAQDCLERIRKSVATGDGEAAGQAAHSIKGAAASLGLTALSGLAYEIEKAGTAGELKDVRLLLSDLEKMIGQLASLRGPGP